MDKVYNVENRLYNDECSIQTEENQNLSIYDYYMFNTTADCKISPLNEHLFENNIVIKDGYGFTTGCTVDNDTKMRLGGIVTNERERQNLCTRTFHGGPNLNKGGLVPNIETILKNPDDTSDIRNCEKISEINYNRFIPLIGGCKDVQNPNHIIDPWTRGGDPTRWDIKNKCITKPRQVLRQ